MSFGIRPVRFRREMEIEGHLRAGPKRKAALQFDTKRDV